MDERKNLGSVPGLIRRHTGARPAAAGKSRSLVFGERNLRARYDQSRGLALNLQAV